MAEDQKPRLVDPPKSSTSSGSASGTTRRGSTRETGYTKIEDTLNEFFGSLSMGFAVAGNDVCAVVFSERGPAVSKAWTELAKQNPAVKRVLEKLVEGGAWGAVIVSTVSLAVPVGQYYKVIPQVPFNPFGITVEEMMKIQEMQMARQGAAPNGN